MNRWALIIGLVSMGTSAFAADFPQFRGPSGDGIVPNSDLPQDWEKGKNIAWKRGIPGSGWSQPVVINDTIFVTTAVGDKLARPKDMSSGARDMASIPGMGKSKGPNITLKWQLLALDLKDGSVKWTRTVEEAKPKFPIHPSNTYATETPCVDAERVSAYFGATGSVVAFDHAGKPIWNANIGAYPHSNGFGSGSSMAIDNGILFLNCFNEEKGFVLALDAQTGRQIWRKDRARGGSSWASPFIWKNSKRVEVVACGDKLVTSHDPRTGEELWRLGGIDTAFAPSPAADGDTLILAASSPFSSSPMYAIRAGAKGDITLEKKQKSNANILWSMTNAKVGMASPVAKDGFVYFASNGLLTCYSIANGERVYSERLSNFKTVAASPLLMGDRILVLDEAGRSAWVKTGKTFETVGGGSIADITWATPAIAGNSILVRGLDGLYCVRK
ncbi:MAG: PQQ-binding-like beta-propeller repeat protein [Gemmataceae bacterium]